MLGPEIVYSIQDCMKLFRVTEFLPTGNGHFLGVGRVGIIQTFLKGIELHEEWNFNFSCNTSTNIRAECSCVSNSEAVRGFDLDFILFAVDFSHSFDLPEGDGVPIR